MGKKFLLSSLLASLLLSGTYALSLENVSNTPTNSIEVNSSQPIFAESELIITFNDDANMSSIASDMKKLFSNATTKEYSLIKAMHIKVPGVAADVIKSNLLEKAPFKNQIKTIENNYKFSLNEATNDTYYSKLWAVENTAQEVNGESGTKDADMDVKEAWDISKGSSDVIVAVLDTGVDYTHSDLTDNMWKGATHYGYDFAANDDGDNDDDPMPEQPYDENGHYHGTHVAGIIGAVGDNSTGVSGVAQSVQIMALKVFRPNGAGYSSDILEALDYISSKIDEGVKVVAINASYGGSGGSNGDSMDQAIQKLGDKGVVFIAAAGNDGKDIDSDPVYPASYSATNIIAVAASDQDDKLASFSNYGKNTVDVAAPGENILSTYPDNQYAYANGTSMATPEVTGVVSLLAAVAPDSSVDDKIDAIKSSVDKKDDLTNKVATEGRVNSYSALKTITDSEDENSAPVANDDNSTTEYNTKVVIDVLQNDSDANNDALTIISLTQPKNGEAKIVDNKIEYTPNDGFSGDDSFSYTIEDEHNATATANVVVTVEEKKNSAPVAQDDSASVDEDNKILIDVLANDSDADGDALEIVLGKEPSYGSVKVVDNKIEYTPNKDYNGQDSFTYSVSDSKEQSQEATVSITINPVNDAPVAEDDSESVDEGSRVLIDVLKNDSDVEGDTLTIKSVTQPENGEAKIVDNKIEYTPNEGFSGDDSFSYTIEDEHNAVATANVTVTVEEKNNLFPPRDNNEDKNITMPHKNGEKTGDTGVTSPRNGEKNITKDDINQLHIPKLEGTFFFPKNTTKILDVLKNTTDENGNKLFLIAVGTPKHGSAEIVNNTIKYTPNQDYTGADTFSYTVSNGESEASAMVKVMVTDNTQEEKEFVFPIIGEEGTEVPTKVIGEFEEKVEDGKHILSLKDRAGDIVIDDESGAVQLENISAPIPSEALPAGTEIELEDNHLKVKFSLQNKIKFN